MVGDSLTVTTPQPRVPGGPQCYTICPQPQGLCQDLSSARDSVSPGGFAPCSLCLTWASTAVLPALLLGHHRDTLVLTLRVSPPLPNET